MVDFKNAKHHIPDTPDYSDANKINARMAEKMRIRRLNSGTLPTEPMSDEQRRDAEEFLNRLVEGKNENKG